MKRTLKSLLRLLALFVITLSLVSALGASVVLAEDQDALPALTAEWWQYVLSIPASNHPLLDSTGQYCRVKQIGSAFFLVGSWVGDVTRECRVPANTPILIPLIVGECSDIEEEPFRGETAEERQDCAQNIIDYIDQDTLVATVDGEDVEFHSVLSPDFKFTMPPGNNILGLKGQRIGYSSSGGFWLYVESLTAGAHEIHVEGACIQDDDDPQNPYSGFSQNVIYNLRIIVD